MLIAQAVREGLTIVAHDKHFSDYNVALLPA
jgi:PIN domain nuclease of toxin-antitoxin system